MRRRDYLAVFVVMLALCLFALWLSATGRDDGNTREGVGWIIGPPGIVFFGVMLVRGLTRRTDEHGRFTDPRASDQPE